MWAAASGDAGAVVADLDQDPVAVAGGARGQPAVPMAGERSWANPAPMHFPNKPTMTTGLRGVRRGAGDDA
jgi:hypothetical protein